MKKILGSAYSRNSLFSEKYYRYVYFNYSHITIVMKHSKHIRKYTKK